MMDKMPDKQRQTPQSPDRADALDPAITSAVRFAANSLQYAHRDCKNFVDLGEHAAVVTTTVRMLQDEPTTQRDISQWHSVLFFLSLLEPEKAKNFEARETASAQRWLNHWKKSPENGGAFTGYSTQIAELKNFMSVQAHTLSMNICREEFVKLENAFIEKNARNTPNLIKNTITAMQENVKSRSKYNARKASDLIDGILESGSGEKFSKTLQKNSGGDTYEFIYKDGAGAPSKWLIGKDTFSNLCLRRSDDPSCLAMVSSADMEDVLKQVFEKNGNGGRMLVQSLEAAVKKAVSEQGSEQDVRNVAIMNGVDLLDHGDVVYLRVFRPGRDIVVDSTAGASSLIAAALKHRYKDRLTIHPPLVSKNPVVDLQREISLLRKAGKKNFYIEVYAHGSEKEFSFDEKFTSGNVADMVENNSDCHFTLNTIACHGAGMQKGMQAEYKRRPDLARRLNVFLQQKPYAVAMTTHTAKPGHIDGEHQVAYLFHLANELFDTKNVPTYGAAARRSDLETKKYTPNNAESLIGDILISQQKADIAFPLRI